MSYGLATKLGMGTLRSRPTLTALAILLLALGTAVTGGIFGSLYIVKSLQTDLLSALTLEMELTTDSDASRTAVMSRVERWPGADYIQYVTPDQLMGEIATETGENLRDLFTSNPFPALVRVRFKPTSVGMVDSLARVADQWPEVMDVTYPKRLWGELQLLAARFQSDFSLLAIGFTLLIVVLTGFCLRAQVRNRMAVWEFLSLLGADKNLLRKTLFIQEFAVGIGGGLLACFVLFGLTLMVQWLLLWHVDLPVWFYLCLTLLSSLLAFIAGLLSPQRMMKR